MCVCGEHKHEHVLCVAHMSAVGTHMCPLGTARGQTPQVGAGARSGHARLCPHRPVTPPKRQFRLMPAWWGGTPACQMFPAVHCFCLSSIIQGQGSLFSQQQRQPEQRARVTWSAGAHVRCASPKGRGAHPGSHCWAPRRPGRALSVPGEPLSALGSLAHVLSAAFEQAPQTGRGVADRVLGSRPPSLLCSRSVPPLLPGPAYLGSR